MNPWARLKQLGESYKTPKILVEDRQKHWLMACLRRNQSTLYGQRCTFPTIKSVGDYQKRVPLVHYEDVRRDIGVIQRGGEDILFQGPAAAMEWTGGSTQGKKLIPYSEKSFSDIQLAALPWLGRWITKLNIWEGTIFWGLSPAVRCGGMGVSEADYLGRAAAGCLRQLSAVSPKDHYPSMEDWKWDTLSQLIHRPDLVLVSVWSPTFFMTLLDFLDERLDNFMACFPSHPGLQRYRKSGDLYSLWPRLRGVSCWMDGASARYATALKKRLPWCSFEPKGLVLTEGVVTFPDETARQRLALESGFYEFLDGHDHPLLAHQLKRGNTYEVVLTTSGGLYRYRTGDSVSCVEMYCGEPVLRFEGRKGLVSDLVGEKLSDAFVSRCLKPLRGFAMLTPLGGCQPGYELVVDQKGLPKSTTAMIEKRLRVNPHYDYARRVGQLRPLSLIFINQPERLYQNYALKQGQRFGDIKIPSLSLIPRWWEKEPIS